MPSFLPLEALSKVRSFDVYLIPPPCLFGESCFGVTMFAKMMSRRCQRMSRRTGSLTCTVLSWSHFRIQNTMGMQRISSSAGVTVVTLGGIIRKRRYFPSYISFINLLQMILTTNFLSLLMIRLQKLIPK